MFFAQTQFLANIKTKSYTAHFSQKQKSINRNYYEGSQNSVKSHVKSQHLLKYTLVSMYLRVILYLLCAPRSGNFPLIAQRTVVFKLHNITYSSHKVCIECLYVIRLYDNVIHISLFLSVSSWKVKKIDVKCHINTPKKNQVHAHLLVFNALYIYCHHQVYLVIQVFVKHNTWTSLRII